MHALRYLHTAWLLLGIVHAAELRPWTDLQNRRIEARMIRLDGTSVILELKDGRQVPLALAKLCETDATYARGQDPAGKPSKADPAAPNFADAWPERIKFVDDPEISTVVEDVEKKRFIYESANYRYTSDARLSKSLVKGFAVMFEATHQFCRTLPLGLDGGVKTDGKLQIFLFERFDDYLTAGGQPGSAGIFMSGKEAVLVPLTSLGLRHVGSGYMLDREKSSKTLPHELTHQLTPHPYFQPGSMGWFSEGLAEYVAVTPYRSGSFNVRNNHSDIVAYTTSYGTKNAGGRALGKNIRVPDLKGFMLQDYARFMDNAQLNYGCSLLLTYYFLQMDGAGDGQRAKAFLTALRKGKTGEDALAVLLDGRSYEQLAKDITKAWKRRGIELVFGTSN
ncbi:MAG: hypothetical protein DVB26_00850 [Verrucomicrobia bacterium]|nr:MAG: hypothetical protein DVB26_00850 [Verrucomicrobiota bacterium]